MSRNDLVPASREVLRHHSDQHECIPGWPVRPGHDAVCPCNSTVALLCDGCGYPLFLACNPSRPLCRHAREGFEHGSSVVRWTREPRAVLLARLTGGGELS